MSVIDHLFILLLVLLQPAVGYVSYQRLLRRIDAGAAVSRSDLYLRTITGQWVLFVAGLAIWYFQDRSWTVLGFGAATGPGFIIGIILTVLAVIVLLLQLRQVSRASDEQVNKFRQQLGNIDFMLPRNGNELGRFYGLALTAGIVEETLWRGYIIWYGSQFMPVWTAALLSAAGFGMAHAYQGIRNVPKITFVGAGFAGLFVLSGSLWLPMFLHAAVDIVQGRLAYNVVRRSDLGSASTGDIKPVRANASLHK